MVNFPTDIQEFVRADLFHEKSASPNLSRTSVRAQDGLVLFANLEMSSPVRSSPRRTQISRVQFRISWDAYRISSCRDEIWGCWLGICGDLLLDEDKVQQGHLVCFRSTSVSSPIFSSRSGLPGGVGCWASALLAEKPEPFDVREGKRR